MARHSLVPHGNDSLCATISIITSLSADDLSAQLRRAGNGHPYSYTCKFEGITPLYEDKNGADVDIIAVPGLGSHALSSWKSPNSNDVWLRDFLPKDVPNICRFCLGSRSCRVRSKQREAAGEGEGAVVRKVEQLRL
ncbi:hypothetical protein B0T10DRAFT_609236 [Thelonectria olida]|uniref:Uncharacterized protein n=1 Tax=Thelonectria olida TaxID=1576542 RepID=A0A9P9AHY5_9HYPO|nr:hypothetical protein B0T10DRAFT_609236 [Thelonectria olida]